ncbi:hypothetical protein GQ57_35865 [Burkholderia sp. MSh2]|uniref:Uncharacterized protein n=1 Tax=Burkholderia paludis TaxID=1506587 RepID=A0A6J5F4U4_9BURK|nr:MULTISPECIES: hypothetical protein [Burkholderia]KEZ01314.1 hypothetical protein GQ57_35865 [Burkholderia sp. MSh2]CAB3772652.1 hypothetical protein LMG30113_06782 [Burkholderia paludis]VWB63946.1 hypothetical protein BPA30113_02849 [Burkholderia paludis]
MITAMPTPDSTRLASSFAQAPQSCGESAGEPVILANEFAGILVQKISMRQGDRLRLKVLPDGAEILLDPMQLEAIMQMQPADFSGLLARAIENDEAGEKPE